MDTYHYIKNNHYIKGDHFCLTQEHQFACVAFFPKKVRFMILCTTYHVHRDFSIVYSNLSSHIYLFTQIFIIISITQIIDSCYYNHELYYLNIRIESLDIKIGQDDTSNRIVSNIYAMQKYGITYVFVKLPWALYLLNASCNIFLCIWSKTNGITSIVLRIDDEL